MVKKCFSRIISFSALVTVLFGCISCGLSKPTAVSFSGKWNQVFEHFVLGNKETSKVTVITDGNRFRIEGKNSIMVYDGNYLYTKIKGDFWGSSDFTQAKKISSSQAKSYKFWSGVKQGKAGPGGNIAGQETILYQVRMNRPDGEITSQSWVDAKTRIVLKDIQTIYSRQVSQMITKQTSECLKINYGSVNDTAFTKPE